MTAAHVALRSDGKWLAIEGKEQPAYWCVVCMRPILSDHEGLYMHNQVPHPLNMLFDEEDNPQ